MILTCLQFLLRWLWNHDHQLMQQLEDAGSHLNTLVIFKVMVGVETAFYWMRAEPMSCIYQLFWVLSQVKCVVTALCGAWHITVIIWDPLTYNQLIQLSKISVWSGYESEFIWNYQYSTILPSKQWFNIGQPNIIIFKPVFTKDGETEATEVK